MVYNVISIIQIWDNNRFVPKSIKKRVKEITDKKQIMLFNSK